VQLPAVLKAARVDTIIVTAMAYQNEILKTLRQEFGFRGTIALLGRSLQIVH
jgi:hypothetical protein